MMWRWGLKLALFLSCYSGLLAQSPHPLLRNYDAKDGLPSSEVYDILQDRQGYIWISTDNGVARFNGYEFETFGPEQGLTDPVIFYLFEDHRGWIWMYGFRGEVFIYRQGSINLFAHSDLIKSYGDNDSHEVAEWIYVDREGFFYTGTGSNGIVKIGEDGSCVEITAKVPFGIQIWIHEGRHFLAKKGGPPFWHSNTRFDPIFKKYRGKKQVISVIDQDEIEHVLTVPIYIYATDRSAGFFQANQMTYQAKDECLIQLEDRLQLINVKTGEALQHIPYQQGAIISELTSERHQMLFLGHQYGERGLAIYDRIDFRKDLNILSQPTLKILKNITVSHLLEDRQGGLWIGTTQNGIYYIPDPSLLLAYFLDERLALPRSIAIIGPDSTLIRTQDYQIYVADSDKQLSRIPQELHKSPSYQVHYDKQRRQILASGYLMYWSQQQNRWLYIMQEGHFSPKVGLQSDHNQLTLFTQSRNDPNHYWCINSSRYYGVDLSQNPPGRSPDYSLASPQRIFSILETSRGHLYIGGMEGLYEQLANGKSHRVDHHPALAKRIEDLKEMSDGTLVIGTKGGGVLFWNQDTTLQLTEAHGLTSSSVEQLHIDEQEQIWVGTNLGLNRVQLAADWSYTIEAITYADGLPSNEITAINSWGKKLWVGTVEGLLTLPIHKALDNGPIIPVVEHIRINGIERDIDALSALDWFEDNIRITVRSLDYPQAGRITYRYRFADDAPWQTTQSSLIEVARLSPGNYDFEIQAKGRNGEWSEATGFPLHLQNPFWKNLFFWLGVAGLVFAFVVWYFNRSLRRKAREQEQQQQLLQLENELNELRQQAYRAQMNPHFVYNCLTAIQAYMLSSESDQLLASDYLSKFATLTRQALAASRQKAISLEKDIEMLENYILLEQFRFGHSFQYEIDIDPQLPTYDTFIPALLIQPYVENAILYALSGPEHKGQLNIHYFAKDDNLCITITDNGPGIFQHQQEKIRPKFQQEHQSAGMDIALKRIESTGSRQNPGRVMIEELKTQGQIQGTQIRVFIPIGFE